MKNLIFPITFISLVILLLASFYKVKTEIKNSSDSVCTKDIECQVSVDKTNYSNSFILETNNKTILYPKLESNSLILVENSKVRVCYTGIDSTDPNHKTILINKVVFLP